MGIANIARPRRVRGGTMFLCGAAVLAFANGAAWAQDSADVAAEQGGDQTGGEIIVTARKRAESLQNVPLAITAIGGEQLNNSQITSLGQIAQISPSVRIHSQLGSPDAISIYLRGFGVNTNDPAQNPAVAVFVDGIYQAQVNGTQLDTFDLEAVEVLKGPQGTLLGKNAPSGALSVRTRRPSMDFGGAAQLTYERFDSVHARGYINVPLVQDKLAAKLTLSYKNGGDWQKTYDASAFAFNPVTNSNEIQKGAPYSRKFGGADLLLVRLGLEFQPSSDFEWYLVGDYIRNRSPQRHARPISIADGSLVTPEGYPALQPAPALCSAALFCTPLPKYSNAPSVRVKSHIDTFDVRSIADWDVGAVSLTSVTGFKRYEGDNDADINALPVPGVVVRGSDLNVSTFSQELRVSSEQGGGLDLNGKLDWVIGAYYFDNKFNYFLPLEIFGGASAGGLSVDQFQRGHDKSYALFAHAEYSLTDAWKVAVGVRQTWDEKYHETRTGGVGVPFIVNDKKWDNFSIEAGTSYQIDRDKLIYFRYAEGYRGGGMQPFPGVASAATPYDPETVTAYEGGLKTEWLDRRLRVNLDVFLNEYKNLQRNYFVNNVQVTRNAASAKIKGFEIETVLVPTERIRMRAGVAYLDAKYDSFQADLLGQGIVTENKNFRFQAAPKWAWSAGIDADVVKSDIGTVTAGFDFRWMSKQSLNVVDLPAGQQKAYGVADARIRFEDPSARYSVTLYAQNLLNQYYFTSVEPVAGIGTSATEGMPRVFGITAGVKF